MGSIRGSKAGWTALKKRRPKKPMRCYEDRREWLNASGFTNYSEYLKSNEWAVIRARIIAAFRTCLLCFKPSCQVHHLDYSEQTLLGFRMESLVALCDSCHEEIEFHDKKKLTLREANAKLVSLARRTARGRRWIGLFFKHEQERRKEQQELHANRKTTEEADAIQKMKEAEGPAKRLEQKEVKKQRRFARLFLCKSCGKNPKRGRHYCQECTITGR